VNIERQAFDVLHNLGWRQDWPLVAGKIQKTQVNIFTAEIFGEKSEGLLS